MVKSDTAKLDGLTPKEAAYFNRSRRMAQRYPRGPRLFSKANRVIYRLTGGRLGSKILGVPIGLLTTTGRQSGRNRTVPVVYIDDGARFLLVASNNGFDASPAWLLNLRALPDAEMRTRHEVVRVVAHELTDSERGDIWPRLLEHNAAWGAYQSCTTRQLAVVALERH